MKIYRAFLYYLFFAVIIISSNGYAEPSNYLVSFEEGYYSGDNRYYRARVTVYKNNKKATLREIKGSSLPNRFLYYLDENRPIVSSGEYDFDVLFSRKFKKALRLNGGGHVGTINPNPNHQYNYTANGIWVHKGRSKGPVKGSEGCLTIDPDDWAEFISLFPDAAEWKKNGCHGKIRITRNLGWDIHPPRSPSNLRIH